MQLIVQGKNIQVTDRLREYVETKVDRLDRYLPTITEQPEPATRYLGASATFTVAGIGGSQLQYQWQFNGSDIPGATGPALLVEDIGPADEGSYQAVLTNPTGSVVSDAARDGKLRTRSRRSPIVRYDRSGDSSTSSGERDRSSGCFSKYSLISISSLAKRVCPLMYQRPSCQ